MHAEIVTPRQRARQLAEAKAREHGCTLDFVIKPFGRKSEPARRAVVYELRETLGWSFPQIGRFLGGRHHTTVLRAYHIHNGTWKN